MKNYLGSLQLIQFGKLLSERFTETLARTPIPSGVILSETEKLTSKTHCLSHQMKLDGDNILFICAYMPFFNAGKRNEITIAVFVNNI